MRYGIISDIHGNIQALSAVLEKLGDVDKYICPGDIVGYGANPDECCDIIRTLNCITVIGNHDAVVANLLDAEWFSSDAKKAILWTRSIISDINKNWLGMLPVTYECDEFVVVHATLAMPLAFHYVYSISSARKCFDLMRNFDICFIGHSHYAEAYIQQVGSETVNHISFSNGGILELKPGFRYIINCGSVGQPRDGNPKVGCGIFDTDIGQIEFKRVRYDIAGAQFNMQMRNLPERLIKRLEIGE